MSDHQAFLLLTVVMLAASVLQWRVEAKPRAAWRGRGGGEGWQRDGWSRDESKALYGKHKSRNRPRRSEKPNIVFIITDDQDSELGSLKFMPKTLKVLQDGGATFTNAFVTTPMCCPSRSSMLTGMYVHNHNTYTNNDNCSSVQWQQTHETKNFGAYLSNVGYRTGYFGKYLNEYNGTYIPPGWTEWVGLIRNTRFYNYSLNFNGKKLKHGDNYYKDYLTDLIANDSVTFLKQSKQYFPNRPVAMVLSMPAPHGPEDAAPQYQHLFQNVTTHRTPSWNFAPNPDKQWILQYTGKMEPIHVEFTDLLHRKRLQTLQSVDDAVEKVYLELKELGELDNTYIIFTSDHGYHLGQYGLLKGKAMPYEFDIKVPFLMRGPGIPAGIRVPNIALNIDIAPTLLDIAGIIAPDHMDGRSILKLLEGVHGQGSITGGNMKRKKAWRDTFLVERGKITKQKLRQREVLEAHQNNLLVTKEKRLKDECTKAEYQPPCKGHQQWECRRSGNGKLRLYKCRHNKTQNDAAPPAKCKCPSIKFQMDGMARREKRLQRQFLRKNVNQLDSDSVVVCDCSGTIRKSTVYFWTEYQILDWIHRRLDCLQRAQMLRAKLVRTRRHLDDDGTSDPGSQESDEEEWDENDSLEDDSSEITGYWDGDDELLDGEKTEAGKLFEIRLPDGEWSADNQRRYKRNSEWSSTPRRRVKNIDSVDFLNDDPQTVSCRVFPNKTVVCQDEVLRDLQSWKKQKENIDVMIHKFKEKLEKLKGMRKHLKLQKPSLAPTISSTTSWELTTVESSTADEYDGNPMDGQTPTEQSETDCNCEMREDESGRFASTGGEVSRSMLYPGGAKKMYQRPKYRKYDHLARSPIRAKKRNRVDRGERKERKKRKKKKKRERLEKKKNKHRPVSPDQHGRDVTRDCNSPNMKCFTHDNDHWATPPLWHHSHGRGKMGSRRDAACWIEGLECTRMDDEHWKVPPKWTLGPFCFCPNSNNNTYWCLRTLNSTHNFLYCEFITGFISFYDMISDPYQLRNAVHDLNYGVLQQLHDTLEKLKACKGSRECSIRTRPVDSVTVAAKNRKKPARYSGGR